MLTIIIRANVTRFKPECKYIVGVIVSSGMEMQDNE